MKKRIILITVFILMQGFSRAAIPVEYNANYQFQANWSKILETLVQLEATRKTGGEIQPTIFLQLNLDFQKVFEFFPPETSFKTTYQQCLSSSQNLASLPNFNGANYNQLENFFSYCSQPLQSIINEISASYTVRPKVVVTPKDGPAPLNVTFDARGSIDPSNDTIPTNNFFRYYRDINGEQKVIGRGAIVNYTFEQEGNYIVHLTARSANTQLKGIFDGEVNSSVNVGPQAAVIAVYVNGKKLREDFPIKIGTQEARKGVLIDGSPTQAKGGRRILSHIREITGKQGFSITQTNDGSPTSLKTSLPSNGEYKIKLTTKDNENNSISKTFQLVVSDPVALIKSTPDEGNTSTTYIFDGAQSYSVISNIRLFTREIYDPNGVKLDTIQGKNIKRQFKIPGTYKVNLTVTDEQNQTNFDQMTVIVDSSEPIAQFKVTPTSARLAPSEFLLDASPSSDIDVLNQADALSYERSFSNTENVEIKEKIDEGKKIRVAFNKKGKYQIKLTVRDNFGKIAEVDREIEVKSTLRPQIIITPLASKLGRPKVFVARTNQTIVNYDRDFGNGQIRRTQDPKIIINYAKAGAYKVKLKVYGLDEETNELNKTVFVGEADKPIASYDVKNTLGVILEPKEICQVTTNGITTEESAFPIARLENIFIDVNDSVNTLGEKGNLKYYFQPKNEDISATNSFNYKFTDVGCQYIDYTLEDTAISKTDKKRIWFKVDNARPEMENLTLVFPQYGNEIGIGFSQTKKKDIFKIDYDPLIVKVNLVGGKDPDGFISYYQRYYYNKDDPNRKLEIKITPSNLPYAYFSLPRIPGEFMFGAQIFDNDGGNITSEEVIGKGPVVFFPPDTKNIDIPLVTLKVSPINVRVGDEVIFEVESRILSNRSDFISNRTIKYDFDGDGERDVTTKNDKVSHIYTKPGKYTPRAQVLYRGYPGRAIGENIDVKNALRASFLFDTFDNKVIMRDISIGDIKDKTICFDLRYCKSNNFYSKENETDSFFQYDKYGKVVTKVDIIDEFANTGSFQQIIDLQADENKKILHMMAIPGALETGNNIIINVGKNLNNEITAYIIYNGSGDCYMDKDITIDSDSDGNKEQDRDIACNELRKIPYLAQFDATIGRIYYNVDKKLLSKEVTVKFIDFDIDLPENTKILYTDLSNLINSLDAKTESEKFLKDQL
ncbi:MAG TPA: PKD domain-containing protein, partial [Candidatus Absconditabacterales bacterium]|nr:PKD domain-containing protein [Candidatus Absconditabacterales bacterium]